MKIVSRSFSSAMVAAVATVATAVLFGSSNSVLGIEIGDRVPHELALHHGFPPETISLDARFANKNVLLIGLPGAFTPTWTNRQVPSYLAKESTLQSIGVDDVIIYCVNDAAVMMAWSESLGVPQLDAASEDAALIHLFADPYSTVTERLDMELTAAGPKMKGLVQRCKRFALYVVDGVVQIKHVAEADDDPAGDDRPDVTLPDAMIAAIKEYNNGKNSDGGEL